jgi:hypothetical protein
LIVGTWTSSDEHYSDVEFNVTRSRDSYVVQVCDGFDGEKADIFETAWDGRILSFAAQLEFHREIVHVIGSCWCQPIAQM